MTSRSLTDLAALSLLSLFSLVGAVDLGEAERQAEPVPEPVTYPESVTFTIRTSGDYVQPWDRIVRIPLETTRECL